MQKKFVYFAGVALTGLVLVGCQPAAKPVVEPQVQTPEQLPTQTGYEDPYVNQGTTGQEQTGTGSGSQVLEQENQDY